MVPRNESNTTTDAISAFVDAIRSSNILSERQLAKLEAILAEGEHSSKPGELASRLVKDGILTEYQAKQVLKGKAQGLTFGGYIILDFLGKGTMGKVYKASHRMMGRVVALKVLEPRAITSTRSLARFQREMQLVGRLDHPNVVRAFDADKVGECHFIAMEYADGYTLEDLLKAKGALPAADVVYYASQAAEGLAHAHAKGVVHRDIKPSNLLLTPGKKLKVLDFGLGTLVQQEEQESALTTAGMAVGTPDYISPEQARMVKLDGRSDLYSLGCTMYHLLSGKLPFKGESSMDCIVGRITGKPIPISDVMPGLPPRLIEAIDKLMATNPDDRYQTADEAAAALRSLLRPKNAPRAPQEPALAPPAARAAPQPAPKESPPAEVTLPPIPAATRSSQSKPKKGSPRAGSSKSKAILAGVAVAAVALCAVVAAVLFWPSTSGTPASQEPPLATTSAPTAAADGADARQPSPAVESPAQVAATPAKEPSTSVPVVPAATASVRKPSLVIESPQEGATVDMREELTGRIESDGWPVIFVQADIPGQPWWCQAPVAQVEGGKFTANVVFGDETTPSGMRFRVTGILARTREEATKFTIGSKHQAPPAGYPKSAEVVVTHR